jgi:hypothetical protein
VLRPPLFIPLPAAPAFTKKGFLRRTAPCAFLLRNHEHNAIAQHVYGRGISIVVQNASGDFMQQSRAPGMKNLVACQSSPKYLDSILVVLRGYFYGL